MSSVYRAGVTRIKQERMRQAEKDYTAEHDVSNNSHGELVSAAEDLLDYVQGKEVSDCLGIINDHDGTQEELLEKAGALIAAELDRRSKIETNIKRNEEQNQKKGGKLKTAAEDE